MSNKRPLIYIFIFILYFIKNTESKCDSIYVSLSLRALNEGFHRELKYSLKLHEQKNMDFWSQGGCRLALEQHLPAGAYVNADELHDLKRMNKVHACPVGEVDVEKPMHMSRPLVIYVYTSINSSQLTITLPIHLRYHSAKLNGGYETVKVDIPSVLLRCPNNVFKLCENVDTVKAPCVAFSPHKCSWHNITIKSLSSPVEMSVPIGDMKDYASVAFFTYFYCFGGCLYLICVVTKIKFRNKHEWTKIKTN